MLYINSIEHATALFFRNGRYYFYDSNAPAGEHLYNNVGESAQATFYAHQHPQFPYQAFAIRAFTPRLAPIFAKKLRPQMTPPFPFPTVYPTFPRILTRGGSGTALHLAARVDCLTSCQALITQIDPNSTDSDAYTPLHCAQSVEIIRLLYTHGGNIDAKDTDGNTPLILACGEGYLPPIKALIECHADSSIRNDDKETAEEIAIECDFQEIVAFLRQHRLATRQQLETTSIFATQPQTQQTRRGSTFGYSSLFSQPPHPQQPNENVHPDEALPMNTRKSST